MQPRGFEDEIGNPDATIVGNPIYASRVTPKQGRSGAAAEFDAVVMAAEAAHRQGLPVDRDTICRQNENLNPRRVETLLADSTKLKRALEDRGIFLTTVNGLTERMVHALRIIFDPTLKADLAKRLRIANVSHAEFEGWRQYEPFAKRYRELGHDTLKDMTPIARQRIAMGMDAGKLDYIKFGMELTGEYDPRGGPSVDVQVFGRLMMDVIGEELQRFAAALGNPDAASEAQRRIGARMLLVMQGRQNEPLQELEAVVIDDNAEQRSA